jgi:hypothetical protein
MVGAIGKATRRGGFARGVLRSEDGGGEGNRSAAAVGGSLLSGGGARQGRGGGRENRATRGGRRVTSRGAWSRPVGDSAGNAATARLRRAPAPGW